MVRSDIRDAPFLRRADKLDNVENVAAPDPSVSVDIRLYALAAIGFTAKQHGLLPRRKTAPENAALRPRQ